jgi:hypothetical protein
MTAVDTAEDGASIQLHVEHRPGMRECRLAARSASECCPSHPQKKGRREGRELAAPMAPVRKEMHGARTTGPAETSRPSLREWVTAYTCSPQGPAFLPLSCARLVKALHAWPQHREARTTRLHRPHRCRSSDGIDTSIAARLHVRDDAYAPFDEAGCESIARFLKKRKKKFASRRS